VRAPSILRTQAYRIVLVYVTVFAVSVTALIAFTYWNTKRALDAQTDQIIEAEITGLSEQYQQLGLRGLGNLRCIEFADKFRSPLLDVVAVFAVAPQHEILLVPAHHQHRDQQGRLMELIDPRFDVVDGGTQAAFKTGLLVEAEALLFPDDSDEVRLVLLQRGAHGLDLACQIGLARGDYLAAKRVDIGGGGFCNPDLAVGFLLIVAEQKILFRPPAFQQLDADLAVQLKQRPRVVRRFAIDRDGGFAVHVHAADQDHAGDADDADRGNFVG